MLQNYSHRRFNILTGEWILVSSHRVNRPWQGQIEKSAAPVLLHYEAGCYLCPGNKRANGETNPNYQSTFVFTNDFSALIPEIPASPVNDSGLLIADPEEGICRVVCFSAQHDLTLAMLGRKEIEDVIKTWQAEYSSLGQKPFINYVQIFENKGQLMGCSNPHPHGQIWAEKTIPVEPEKEQIRQLEYLRKQGRPLLTDYLQKELEKKERIVYQNDGFVLLVPFWAVWPFETMILPRKEIQNISQLSLEEISLFADAIKVATVKYDNIFRTSFPYSAGIHQAPTDGSEHSEWQLHMHFYPPLLRSATIKKFMVGYELLANPQRDITPEQSAEVLRNSSSMHYLSDNS